ncbi:MAG: ABC transporter ATP-binding protein [Candidatus Aminicenantes bacterium]|nr:ABC transporter ATP-binding protein [Candidatus Aminicenantes bacterium]
MNNILRAESLSKKYPLPKGMLTVFDNLNFELEKGKLIAIMGVSGVGKTTLLNLFGALDRPTGGKMFLDGEDLFARSDRDIAEIRNKDIGFVFQFYHLLPEFSALENISFPLLIRGLDKKMALKKSLDILKEVDLEEKAHIRPFQLSGGEQQRIAIARALINAPKILLADEPTGNLDWKTGQNILEIVRNLHNHRGLSSIIVTHNEKVAKFCDEAYVLENGQLKLFPLP